MAATPLLRIAQPATSGRLASDASKPACVHSHSPATTSAIDTTMITNRPNVDHMLTTSVLSRESLTYLIRLRFRVVLHRPQFPQDRPTRAQLLDVRQQLRAPRQVTRPIRATRLLRGQ